MTLHSRTRFPRLPHPLLTAAGVALCLATVACSSTRPSQSKPTVIPLGEYVAGLRTVDALVSGKPHKLLFDTAGGGTILTPKVAAEAGCEAFGQWVGFRHDGSKLALPRCGPVPLAVGALGPRAEEAAIFDLMALLAGAPEVGGIAGLGTFEGETLTLDFSAGTITVETAASRGERIRDMVPLRVRASRQAGGAALDLMVAVEGRRGTLWFELDSGSVAPLLIAPHAARELGVELSKTEPREIRLPVEGLGLVALPALEKEMIYDGLIGHELLRQVVVTVDLERIQAWAKRRP